MHLLQKHNIVMLRARRLFSALLETLAFHADLIEALLMRSPRKERKRERERQREQERERESDDNLNSTDSDTARM